MLCSAYLSESALASGLLSDADPYDQYEVSIPLQAAGDCLKLVKFPHAS